MAVDQLYTPRSASDTTQIDAWEGIGSVAARVLAAVEKRRAGE